MVFSYLSSPLLQRYFLFITVGGNINVDENYLPQLGSIPYRAFSTLLDDVYGIFYLFTQHDGNFSYFDRTSFLVLNPGKRLAEPHIPSLTDLANRFRYNCPARLLRRGNFVLPLVAYNPMDRTFHLVVTLHNRVNGYYVLH